MTAASHFIADFPAIDAQTWKDKLYKDLKGVSFEDLTKSDRNGIDIMPFYTQTNESLTVLPTVSDWYIVEPTLDAADEVVNATILEALNHGASGISLHVDQRVDFEKVLAGVGLSYIHLVLHIDADESIIKDDFLAYIDSLGLDISTLSVQLVSKRPFDILSTDSNIALHVNGAWIHQVGANAVTEIAMIAAQVNAGLDALSISNQLALLQKIYVHISIDTQFFEQMSKLRAARILIQNICAAYHIQPTIHIHTTTSPIYQTQADVYNNLLRSTISGMAAVIGSSDSVHILTFDASDAAFARRMSRNQQLLFKEEAYMQLVQDKAAGAYFIESYTHAIAEKAWTLFQSYESLGGFDKAIMDSQVRSEIEAQAKDLVAAYQSGNKVLVGVNKYKAVENLQIEKLALEEAFGFPFINLEQAISS